MITKQQLLDLAERVEREEPSEELRDIITFSQGWIWHNEGDVGAYWTAPDGACWDEPPDWLHSLDAAVTLVPDGVQWRVQCTGTYIAAFYSGELERWIKSASKTPAAALTSAALRARALEARDE